VAAFIALFDACVLYPAPLRDLLLSLAQTELFRARWTDEIQDEWIHSLLRDRPELEKSLARTRQLMTDAVPDCLITGYQSLIPSLNLPDENDRHVLAAAIVGRASVIVTYNLKDFPQEALSPFNLFAEHPDQFIGNLFDLAPPQVAAEVKKLRARLKNPPLTVDELLDIYLKAGLPEVAAGLATMRDLL